MNAASRHFNIYEEMRRKEMGPINPDKHVPGEPPKPEEPNFVPDKPPVEFPIKKVPEHQMRKQKVMAQMMRSM